MSSKIENIFYTTNMFTLDAVIEELSKLEFDYHMVARGTIEFHADPSSLSSERPERCKPVLINGVILETYDEMTQVTFGEEVFGTKRRIVHVSNVGRDDHFTLVFIPTPRYEALMRSVDECIEELKYDSPKTHILDVLFNIAESE